MTKETAAAAHKTTARKTETAIMVIMPLLSPPLCCLFCMSTPRGFIVPPLLPPMEYGPPSIMVMVEGGKGGEGGKPIYIGGSHKTSYQKSHRKEVRQKTEIYIYLDSSDIIHHSLQSRKLL